MNPTLEPLELLYGSSRDGDVDLPEALETTYGGPLRLAAALVFANFVSSIDGVVAIASRTQSSAIVSDGSEADRFVMGLLRACADVVLVGSGTLRGSPKSIWTAERVYPPATPHYGILRARLGADPRPQLAVLTASGSIDADHPALEAGALVLTTERGSRRLDGRLPGASELVILQGEDGVDLRAAVELLRDRGYGRILSEAGPTVTGSLLAAGVLDELFLTVSPVVAGRSASDDRLGLVEGTEFLPGSRVAGRLVEVRRHHEHLFLRYAFH